LNQRAPIITPPNFSTINAQLKPIHDNETGNDETNNNDHDYEGNIAHGNTNGGDDIGNQLTHKASRQAIRVVWCKKPGGSPGRGGASGYNLQAELQMTDGGYDIVWVSHKIISLNSN
jgi:hypothetical protein